MKEYTVDWLRNGGTSFYYNGGFSGNEPWYFAGTADKYIIDTECREILAADIALAGTPFLLTSVACSWQVSPNLEARAQWLNRVIQEAALGPSKKIQGEAVGIYLRRSVINYSEEVGNHYTTVVSGPYVGFDTVLLSPTPADRRYSDRAAIHTLGTLVALANPSEESKRVGTFPDWGPVSTQEWLQMQRQENRLVSPLISYHRRDVPENLKVLLNLHEPTPGFRVNVRGHTGSATFLDGYYNYQSQQKVERRRRELHEGS